LVLTFQFARPPRIVPAMTSSVTFASPSTLSPGWPADTIPVSSSPESTLPQPQPPVESASPAEPVDNLPVIGGWITHYGDRFQDRGLGCSGYGDYSSDDPTIIAVKPTLYRALPCGSVLQLCGPGGCLTAARKDSCPGCQPNGFDLSEAAFHRVCGDSDGVCNASVKVMKVCERRHMGKPGDEAPGDEAPPDAFMNPVPCQHPPL